MSVILLCVLQQVNFSFKMFDIAIVQKSEFLGFVLSCILYNYIPCPADGLVLCLFESAFILSFLERFAEDLLKGKHRKSCSLPGRATESLYDNEKLSVL